MTSMEITTVNSVQEAYNLGYEDGFKTANTHVTHTRYVKERTCRNVDDFGDNIGGWRDWETDGFGFTCSECGHVLYPDEFGASPLAPELLEERVKINYCPHCGAKVVGD